MKTSALTIAALFGYTNALHMKAYQAESLPGFEDYLVELGAMSANESCTYGIERFTNGTSNSWQAFKNSQNGTKKWEDPEFTADQSSLNWADKWGREEDDYKAPTNLVWKRPEEMGGFDGKEFNQNPTLWGDLGKPVPNGVVQN